MTISAYLPTLHHGRSCLLPSHAIFFLHSPYLPSSLSCPSTASFPSSNPDFVPISKPHVPLPPLCAIPARDIVIDFGKYKGSMMGTLPPTYLRWLIRELRHGRSRVWADYAAEVLKDPFYVDRLEWGSIEKSLIKSDVRRGRAPGGDSNCIGLMKALGWNLEDHAGWSKVNFSALGTTLGGRIPRMAPADSKASVKTVRKKVSEKIAPANSPQQEVANESESLSLREELERRRNLRRERILANLPTKAPAKTSGPIFPGRDALFEKTKKALDHRN